MALITCNCGTRYSGTAAARCSRCGQPYRGPKAAAAVGPAAYPVPPPLPAARYAATTQQTGNSLGSSDAVLGFVLSMFAFFTCMLLAPVSLYLCWRGLRSQEHHGLAVAGLVLSIFQTITLIGVWEYWRCAMLISGSALLAMWQS